MKIKICPQCKTENRAEAVFCKNCRKRLKKSMLARFIIFVIFIVAIAGLGYYLFSKNIDTKAKGEMTENVFIGQPKKIRAIEIKKQKPRLEKQIVIIEQLLSESDDIGGDCLALGTWNNPRCRSIGTLAFWGDENKKTQCIKNCRRYRPIYNEIINFVAEPELFSVKQKLSQVGDVLQEFGAYVNTNGMNGELIDTYDGDLRKLITQTREEILKVKQDYNLEK